MPIQKLSQKKPSEYQLDKARRCVVTTHVLGFWVWDPAVDSQHIVTPSLTCDCLGFQSHGFCSHITAVLIYKERQKDASFEQAVSELFDL